VANYYRLEVYTALGAASTNAPCVYSPLFLMKKMLGSPTSNDNPSNDLLPSD
jgi:hypothetical protein